MTEPRLNPTVIPPDTSPLVHLAAADALWLPNGLGPVVIVLTLQAGLAPPRPPPQQERAELEHAMRVLGIDPAGKRSL